MGESPGRAGVGEAGESPAVSRGRRGVARGTRRRGGPAGEAMWRGRRRRHGEVCLPEGPGKGRGSAVPRLMSCCLPAPSALSSATCQPPTWVSAAAWAECLGQPPACPMRSHESDKSGFHELLSSVGRESGEKKTTLNCFLIKIVFDITLGCS